MGAGATRGLQSHLVGGSNRPRKRSVLDRKHLPKLHLLTFPHSQPTLSHRSIHMITSTSVSACTVPAYSAIEARVIECAQDILRASSARGMFSTTLSNDKGMNIHALALSVYGEISKEYPHVKVEDIRKAISYMVK